MFKLFIFILAILNTSLVLAQPADKNYKIVPAEATIVQDSSEHHRLDKNYVTTVNLTGFGPSLTSTIALQAGKYLDRNSVVLLEATGGTLSTPDNAISSAKTGSSYDVKSTSFGAHFKQFNGNSFYYRAGVDFRKIKYDYKFVYTTGPSDTRHFDGTSIAGNFQIGNQWQWENFTLGCDWVGISLPLTSSTSNEEVVSSTPDYDQARIKDDIDALVKKAHLNFLRFYLGASF